MVYAAVELWRECLPYSAMLPRDVVMLASVAEMLLEQRPLRWSRGASSQIFSTIAESC